MKLIGHQTVGSEVERKARLLRVQQLENLRIIFVRTEDALRIIPASDYVVNRALDLSSRLVRDVIGIL